MEEKMEEKVEKKKAVKINVGTIILANVLIIVLIVVGMIFFFENKINTINSNYESMIQKISGTDKKSITSEEFKTIMENKKFEIDNINEYFDEERCKRDGIINGYVTRESENNYDFRINFFDLKDDNSAMFMYYESIYGTRNDSNGNIKEASQNTLNYSKYIGISNGNYEVTCRIGDTVVFATIKEERKQELIDLLNELGY